MRRADGVLAASCLTMFLVLAAATAYSPLPGEEAATSAPTISTRTVVPLMIYEEAPAPPEPVETPQEAAKTYFDVPLPHDLQDVVFTECEARGVPDAAPVVVAIIGQESEYQTGAESDTGDYGLMQINRINHEWVAEDLGLTVPDGHPLSEAYLDPAQNIRVGVYILSDLWLKYDDPHKALMAYNMGERGAGKLWADGITTSRYSREVMARVAALEGGGGA